MKLKKLSKKVIISIASFSMVIMGSGCQSKFVNTYYATSKLDMIKKYLSSGYLYDINEISEEDIADSIYASYVSSLENSATYYLNADEFKQAQASNEGNYIGVGLKMTWESDGRALLVTDVIPDSSADQAGIKVGDHIITIDNIEVVSANQKEIIEKLSYTGENPITYKVERKSNGQVEEINLLASLVTLDDLSYEILEQVGYIRLQSIRTGTSEHVEKVLKNLEAKKVKGIILDVRALYTNQMDEVAKVCDLFLDEGIAFKLKHGKSEVQSFEMTSGKYEQKIVVLTDGSTRGGAEALVSALKGKAYQIGADTYGLVYVSELIPLEDGSGLSVATGILYDQYGQQLSDKGIEPDEMVFITKEEKIEYIEQGSISQENDSLLKKALEQFSK